MEAQQGAFVSALRRVLDSAAGGAPRRPEDPAASRRLGRSALQLPGPAAPPAVPQWLPRDRARSALACDAALYAAAEAIAAGAGAPGAAPLGPPVGVPREGGVQILDGTEGGWVASWRERRMAEARRRLALLSRRRWRCTTGPVIGPRPLLA